MARAQALSDAIKSSKTLSDIIVQLVNTPVTTEGAKARPTCERSPSCRPAPQRPVAVELVAATVATHYVTAHDDIHNVQ